MAATKTMTEGKAPPASPSTYVPQIGMYQETVIPARLNNWLTSDGTSPIGIIHAKTGMGKTVSGILEIGDAVEFLRKKGRDCSGLVLLPFRVSTKSVWGFTNEITTKQGSERKIGYAMRGDSCTNPDDSVVCQTVGYFLEQFVHSHNDDQELLIMLDEAHDSSWQTDLALNMIMWKIREGHRKIKLLISSATLDVQKIQEQYKVEPELFIVPPEKKDHILHFNKDRCYKPLDYGKLHPNFFRVMTETCTEAFKVTETGNLLVLMPGQEEINKLCGFLESVPDFKDAEVYPLHSQLSREDIEAAINTSINPEIRKVIIATNMVENAITIDGLMGTVDGCVRKENFIHEDGVEELRLTLASQANAVQAYGRSGRQGKTGHAFITICEEQYEQLPKYSLTEVERNPLYPQLIKIFKHELPHKKLLSHVPTSKLNANVRQLAKYEMIEKIEQAAPASAAASAPSDRKAKAKAEPTMDEIRRRAFRQSRFYTGDYSDDSSVEEEEVKEEQVDIDLQTFHLTEVGEIISQLPTSMRVGKFIAECIQFAEQSIHSKHHRGMYYYYVSLIAAWIEHGRSVFEVAFKRPRESRQDFIARRDAMQIPQEDFYRDDCLQTFLEIWFSSYTSGADLRTFCRSNYISYKGIRQIDLNNRGIARTITSITRIRVETMTQIVDFPAARGARISLNSLIIPRLIAAFNESVFQFKRLPSKPGQKPEYSPLSGASFFSKYVLDHSVQNLNANTRPPTDYILALNIRRKGNLNFLGTMVVIVIRPE